MERLIEFYSNTNYFINDAIDRIVVEMHLKKEREGYSKFLLSGCEPGVGTTTTAISLAISLAATGWKTILIDGDLRKIAMHKRLNERIEIGLSEYLSGEVLYSQAIYDTNHINLSYIPSGGKTLNPIILLSSDRFDVILEQLTKVYDYIILDMPSITTTVDPNLVARKMDGIILIAEYAKTDIRSVRESRDNIHKAGGNLTGIIMNKINTKEYGRIVKNYDYYKNQRYIEKGSKLNK